MSAVLLAAGLAAQQRPAQPPQVKSPDVQADRRIVFRILAPKAQAVALMAGDILNLPKGGPEFVKDEKGIWPATVGPVDPGAYRYRFVVDGVPVVDPRNAAISESNTNVWSLVYVPGAEFMDAGKAPHGAVAEVHYRSTALGSYTRVRAGVRRVNGWAHLGELAELPERVCAEAVPLITRACAEELRALCGGLLQAG